MHLFAKSCMNMQFIQIMLTILKYFIIRWEIVFGCEWISWNPEDLRNLFWIIWNCIVYILFGLNVLSIYNTIKVTGKLDTSKYWNNIIQNNGRDVHEEYIFIYCHACSNPYTLGEGVSTTQSEDVPLPHHFCLLQMDISASYLIKVNNPRTYKPVVAVIGNEGGNQPFLKFVKVPNNIHSVVTYKKRYQKYYFLDDDQAHSISLDETLGRELMHITDQKNV